MDTWYVTSKDIIACNGFGFKGVGEHSLSMWLLIPQLFPLVFFIKRRSWVSYVKMEPVLACQVSFRPIWRDLTCLMKSCYVFLVWNDCKQVFYVHVMHIVYESLDVFLFKVSYVLGYKPYAPVVWTVELYLSLFPVLMNYSVWCTPSRWLVELSTLACGRWAMFYMFALPLIYRDLL